MRNWMVSLAMATIGPIFILAGVAARDPEAPEAFRWAMILVGALFTTLGVVTFVFGKPDGIVEFDYEQNRGPMRLLARLFMLFGAMGLLSVVFVPSTIPREAYAPWIVWVFFAWYMWAIMIGAGLEYAAWAGHKDE